jgi:hypothetical protein
MLLLIEFNDVAWNWCCVLFFNVYKQRCLCRIGVGFCFCCFHPQMFASWFTAFPLMLCSCLLCMFNHHNISAASDSLCHIIRFIVLIPFFLAWSINFMVNNTCISTESYAVMYGYLPFLFPNIYGTSGNHVVTLGFWSSSIFLFFLTCYGRLWKGHCKKLKIL